MFPVVGGALYDIYGGNTTTIKDEFSAFRSTMLTLVVIQILVFASDLAVNKGWKIWKRTLISRKQENQVHLVDESKKLIKTASSGSDNLSEGDTTITDIDEKGRGGA